MTRIQPLTFEQMQEEGFDVRHDYSGRGMFGRTCLGLTGDVDDLIRFVRFVERTHANENVNFPMDDTDWLDNVRDDNMGRKMIYYWPNVRVEEDDDDAA